MSVIGPPPTQNQKRFFTPTQRAQVEVILEAIWPGGADNPGARDAGAAEYLDLLLGSQEATYYELADWKPLYVAGLAMLDAAALSRPGVGKALKDLSPDEVRALLADLSTGSLPGFPDAPWQRKFFAAVRGHSIEGCLADPRWGGNRENIIWRWLGYPSGSAETFHRS